MDDTPNEELESTWPRPSTRLLAEETLQPACTSGTAISKESGRRLSRMDDYWKNCAAAVDNYRPITCLPTMWKLLSGILGSDIHHYLNSNGLIPCEQKGCASNCRGAKDQLLTDKAVVKNCKRRNTNLHMVWIDYKKAYDRVPHSWLIECMNLYKVNGKLRDFLAREMQKWTTELTSNGESLGRIPIRRGIFQGDALSPRLFIMAMAPISTILNRMKKGYEMEKGERKSMISHLLYMDDIKLYSKTEEGMKSMVNTLKTISED